MANNIILKRSAVSGKIPTVGSLALGEIAINTFDGKMFFKKDDGAESIVELGRFVIGSGDVSAVDNGDGDYTVTINNDSVTFAKLQNIPTNTMLGRVSDNSGNIEALTPAQIRTFLNVSEITGAEGSVKSVGLALPDIFNVTGSPVTATGTLTATLNSQNANLVFASPAAASGVPGFRALVAADIPDLSWSKVVSGKPTTLSGYGITDAVVANGAIIAGTATKITYDSKGLVTTGDSLSVDDIPDLDWEKITGTPTTLAGYNITDAVTANAAITGGTFAKITFDAKGLVTSGASLIAADIPNLSWNKITSDKPTTLAGYGITNAVISNAGITGGTHTKITFDAKGLVTAGGSLIASDIPNLDWAKIATGKPTTLAGYGITDAVGSGTAVLLTGDQTIAGNKTFSNNVTISGDLIVSGATTTIDATNLSVSDAVIQLARGNSAASATHIGLQAERGTTDAWILFNESNDRWGVYTGADTTTLALTNFEAATFYGALSGNATTATTLQNARNINGVSFNGSADITIADGTKVAKAGDIMTGKLTFELDHQDFFLVKNNATTTNTSAFTWRVENRSWRLWMYGADLVGREAITANVNTGIVNLMTGSTVGSSAIWTAATLTNLNQLTNGPGYITGSGNAATATTLQAARNINGVSFDGSTDITITANTPNILTRGTYLTGSNFNGSAATTWAVDATSANTASKVVARDASGNIAVGTLSAANAIFITSDQIRLKTSTGATGYGVIHRHDGSSYYTLLTNNNDADGTWNSLRPFAINLSSGLVAIGNGLTVTGTLTGTLSGNASTATTLQTARNINGVSFDGSTDITIADSTKLPLAGGTMTGNIVNNTAGQGLTFTTYGSGNGIFSGNADAASSTQANVQIKSWYGIGFGPSITGQTVPQNENAVWIDTRSGALSARGIITTGSQFKIDRVAASGSWAEIDLFSGSAADGRAWNIAAHGSDGKFYIRAFTDARASPVSTLIIDRTGNTSIAGTLSAASSMTISGTTFPQLIWNETDGAVDAKRWSAWINNDGTNSFSIGPQTDAGAGTASLTMLRNGNVGVKGDLTLNIGSKIYIGGVEFKGGGGAPWVVKTTAYTAVTSDRILANTSSGGFTITLPATPALGDEVIIADDSDFSLNNLIVGRNGSTINGVADNLELDIAGVKVHLVYDGTTWETYFDSVATGTNGALATVATTGSYTDLINKPTIPTLPPLALVATTGSYPDLIDKPTAASLGAVAATDGIATNLELRASRVRAETAFSGSGAVTLNYANGDYRKVTATGAITITLSNMPGAGQVGSYMVEATNWGAFTITHPTGTKFAGGVAPTFTASGIDIVTYLVDGTNVIRCLLAAKDVK